MWTAPVTDRVTYKKNPLIQVICQARFPRILSINEIMPVDFQEKIRSSYPVLEIGIEHQQEINIDIAGENPSPITKIKSESSKNYRFSSGDGMWYVNLSSTFLSLSTPKYTSWEDFLQHLKGPMNVLKEIYSPAFFERVGLRYVDVFKRSKINLGGVDWNELIQSYALGFLSAPKMRDAIQSYNCTAEFNIDNGVSAKIHTSTGYFSFEPGNIDDEICFIVDSDIYTARREWDELPPTLEKLHNASLRIMKMIIMGKLHEAMEPMQK